MIRNIVFDIGWVFVHLNSEPFLQFLRAHEVEAPDLNSVLTRVALQEHECGRLTGQQLLERFAQLASRPMDPAEAYAAWVGMFELQPAMVALAQRLSEGYRVYLLSNIGDLHWAHLSREYGLHRIGHGALPSFLAGVMKPEAAIYAEAERRFELEPAVTVFVDDRPENVRAARGRGWQAIEHTSHASTVSALRALGVAC